MSKITKKIEAEVMTPIENARQRKNNFVLRKKSNLSRGKSAISRSTWGRVKHKVTFSAQNQVILFTKSQNSNKAKNIFDHNNDKYGFYKIIK